MANEFNEENIFFEETTGITFLLGTFRLTRPDEKPNDASPDTKHVNAWFFYIDGIKDGQTRQYRMYLNEMSSSLKVLEPEEGEITPKDRLFVEALLKKINEKLNGTKPKE